MTKNQSNARRLIAAFVALLLGKSAPIRWNDDIASMTGDGVIRLPAPRLGDEAEIALLTRLAVHEGGHKEHTQTGFDQRLSRQELGFFNAIEDARMEGRQVQKYPGATVLLSRGLGEMLDTVQDKVDAGAVSAGNHALQLDLVVRGLLAMAPHKPLVDRSQPLLQSLGQHISAEARVAMDDALAELPLLGTSLDAEALTRQLVARLTQANEQQLQEPEQPETDASSEGNEGSQESKEPDEPRLGTASEPEGEQGESQEQEPDPPQDCGAPPSNTDARDDAGEEPAPTSAAGPGAEGHHADDHDAAGGHDEAPNTGGSGNESADGNHDSSGADPSPGATAAAGQFGETFSGGSSGGAEAGEAPVSSESSQKPGGDTGITDADDGDSDVDLGTLIREALASRYGDKPATPSDGQDAAMPETTEADVERLRELFANADPDGPLDQLVQATIAALAQGQTDGVDEAQAAILIKAQSQSTGAGLGLAIPGKGSLEIDARLQGNAGDATGPRARRACRRRGHRLRHPCLHPELGEHRRGH